MQHEKSTTSNNKIVEHNTVLQQHSAALNIGPVNSATWKKSISNSETLNQCNTK